MRCKGSAILQTSIMFSTKNAQKYIFCAFFVEKRQARQPGNSHRYYLFTAKFFLITAGTPAATE